jgi:hypothetical protein
MPTPPFTSSVKKASPSSRTATPHGLGVWTFSKTPRGREGTARSEEGVPLAAVDESVGLCSDVQAANANARPADHSVFSRIWKPLLSTREPG